MKSNGGKTPAEAAEAEPIKFLLSGLAGGIIAGQYFGQLAGEHGNLVTLDMGGTSCDVGLIRDGKISLLDQLRDRVGPAGRHADDRPHHHRRRRRLASPGSTRAGSCASGRRAPGADPGPVCYDTGGEEVTVTDANLVLGRLNPDYFLGGKIALSVPKADWQASTSSASAWG